LKFRFANVSTSLDEVTEELGDLNLIINKKHDNLTALTEEMIKLMEAKKDLETQQDTYRSTMPTPRSTAKDTIKPFAGSWL
jgi:hypothetical protein